MFDLFHSRPKAPLSTTVTLSWPGGTGVKRREEEIPNIEPRRSIGFRFEERKGQEWGQERKNANNEQANKGVSKGRASELLSSPPSPARGLIILPHPLLHCLLPASYN